MSRLTIGLLVGLFALALSAALASLVWVSTSYSASDDAQEALKKADVDHDDWYAFGAVSSPTPDVGVVLYPGAHVSADADAPIARQLARDSGAFVVVTRVPLDFPLLGQDAAVDVIEAYPNVQRWIVGGHSLGGVAAASFATAEPRIDGLLLWASYPSEGTDLNLTELAATSIYGSRDEVLDSQSFEEAWARLLSSTVYVEIRHQPRLFRRLRYAER